MAQEDESQYSATASWTSGLQFVVVPDKSGVAVVFDGAPEHGGAGTGVRPMEGLLASLVSCTAMDVISILKKKRQNVTGFTTNIRGTRQEEHPRVFTAITLEFVVRGYDVSEEAVARAIELSQTKYCPVTNSVTAPVTYTYRIEAEQAPA